MQREVALHELSSCSDLTRNADAHVFTSQGLRMCQLRGAATLQLCNSVLESWTICAKQRASLWREAFRPINMSCYFADIGAAYV